MVRLPPNLSAGQYSPNNYGTRSVYYLVLACFFMLQLLSIATAEKQATLNTDIYNTNSRKLAQPRRLQAAPIPKRTAKPVVKSTVKPAAKPVLKPRSVVTVKPYTLRPKSVPVLKSAQPTIRASSLIIVSPTISTAAPSIKPKPISMSPRPRPVRPVWISALPKSTPTRSFIPSTGVLSSHPPSLNPLNAPVIVSSAPLSLISSNPIAVPSTVPYAGPAQPTYSPTKAHLVPLARTTLAPKSRQTFTPKARYTIQPKSKYTSQPRSKPVARSTKSPRVTPVTVAPKTSFPTIVPAPYFPGMLPTFRPSAAYIPGNPTRTPSVLPPSRLPTFSPSLEPSRPTRTPTREPSRPTLTPTTSPSRPTRRPVPTTSEPSQSPTYPIPKRSIKRGMVINPVSGDPTELNCVWYYNYRAKLVYFDVRYPILFIPTIKDVAAINDVRNAEFPVIFTFNEPDVPTSSSYMPIKDLITNYWPAIAKLKAEKLVCPALTKRNLILWLTDFFKGNGSYVPKCDYINIHWHDIDPTILLDFIDLSYLTFGLPIYISEFSMTDWSVSRLGRPTTYTTEDVIRFLNAAQIGFERRPSVVGYAYFSSVDLEAHRFGSLYNEDRSVRPAGWYYAGLPHYHNISRSVATDVKISFGSDTSPEMSILYILLICCLSGVSLIIYIVYRCRRGAIKEIENFRIYT